MVQPPFERATHLPYACCNGSVVERVRAALCHARETRWPLRSGHETIIIEEEYEWIYTRLQNWTTRPATEYNDYDVLIAGGQETKEGVPFDVWSAVAIPSQYNNGLVDSKPHTDYNAHRFFTLWIKIDSLLTRELVYFQNHFVIAKTATWPQHVCWPILDNGQQVLPGNAAMLCFFGHRLNMFLK